VRGHYVLIEALWRPSREADVRLIKRPSGLRGEPDYVDGMASGMQFELFNELPALAGARSPASFVRLAVSRRPLLIAYVQKSVCLLAPGAPSGS
jgi:hypothetical protein